MALSGLLGLFVGLGEKVRCTYTLIMSECNSHISSD